MKKYITDDELMNLLIKNIIKFYEVGTSEETKVIYKDILCDTKEKLRSTLTDEQKKLFEFLEQNIEAYGVAIIKDAFFFGYRLCMQKILEENNF